MEEGNANSDVSGAELQSNDESTVPAGSGAKGHNESLKDGPESTNASVNLNLSSQYEKTPSLIACHLENYSSMGSNKGNVELNNMEKVTHIPEDGKETIRYQNKKENVIDISDAPHFSTLFQKEVHERNAQSEEATGSPSRENSECFFNLNQVSACQVESNSLMSSNGETVRLNKKGNIIDILNEPECDTSSKKEVREPGFLNHDASPKSLVGVSLFDDSQLSSKEVEDCSSADYLGNTNIGDCKSLCNLSTHHDATCLTSSGNTSTRSVPEVISFYNVI